MKRYCFGVDVGGTATKIELFQTDGILVGKWEIPTECSGNGDKILRNAAASIHEKLQEYHLNPSCVLGVGLGVPGPVDNTGSVLTSSNLGWGYRNVKLELEQQEMMPIWRL